MPDNTFQPHVGASTVRRKKSSPKAPARRTSTAPVIARVKVVLQGIRPQIFRRLEIPTAISLGVLHDILQIAFGWTNSHLHQFLVGDRRFGPREGEFDDAIADESKTRLAKLLPSYDRFVYEYDFGDEWMHLITVEKTLAREAALSYPRCTGGKRAGPPEDCGGPWGYADLLAALSDPGHEEHESMLEWIGDDFDPEAFDLAAINWRLEALAKHWKWRR